MNNTAEIIWKSVGIGVAGVLLTGAMVWGYKMRPTDGPCERLEYIIEDRGERMYLTENELTQLLQSEELYPVGKTQDVISLHKIEQAVQHHPMVRRAECYVTPRNEVRIRLTQRVPMLRIQTPVQTYLIDTDRKVMQARASVRDSVAVATGNIDVKMASKQLADFAEWLQGQPYWRERIHHLHVQSPQTVYLHLRGKDKPRVLMGPIRGYERKLAKLRTFLEHEETVTAGKHYTELDLRFRGQVVGVN